MNNIIPDGCFVVMDLGSTSFHMLIAKEINGSLQIINTVKQPVHLAEGLDNNNRLNEEAMARGIECLASFAHYLEPLAIRKIEIVATYTLRVAVNKDDFIEQAQRVLPYPITIISGEEEARLIYLSTMSSQSELNQKLVIDIGGGSTEIILGNQYGPLLLESKDIGCVTLTQRYFSIDPLNKNTFDQAVFYAESVFSQFAAPFQSHCWSIALGTSGTIRAIHSMLQQLEGEVHCITPGSLSRLIDVIFTHSSLNHSFFSVLSNKRKSIFIAGLAILKALFNTLSINCLSLCTQGIREGILHEMITQTGNQDLEQNIRSLSKQFYIDRKQAQRVLETTKFLYHHYKTRYQQHVDITIAENILYCAAQLYEIGWIINAHSIQKHSAYILKNCQQLTLDKEQKALLVSLIRFHRKAIKVEELAKLALLQKNEILVLLFILRLAVLLNVSRQTVSGLSKIAFSIEKEQIFLSLPVDCLQDNILLQSQLEKETGYWQSTHCYSLSISIK